mmetsp:Transcript_31443/g.71942  ORF Transcript_31443/g.71942 Transcript_31443/m.71942 type:complete len:348 (-) Transcript_31443:1194-2237(-)
MAPLEEKETDSDSTGLSEIASIASSRPNLWTSLSVKNDIDWNCDDPEEIQYLTFWSSFRSSMISKIRTCIDKPTIPLKAVALFLLLTSSLLIILHRAARTQERLEITETRKLAGDVASWFSGELEKAIMPLFTLSQFVQHLSIFEELGRKIGPRGRPMSAPPLLTRNITHRNITGVVSEEATNEFEAIAAKIKKDSILGSTLLNLQLAPHAVVSMIHPLINRDENDASVILDNRGAIGHDLLNDPNRAKIARETVPAPGVVIAGPLALIQSNGTGVEDALIARLAIHMANNSLIVDEVDYECWGFVVIIIDWGKLKKKSGLYTKFEREGLEFNMVRLFVDVAPFTFR